MSCANRFPSSQHTRYRSSWGPTSTTVFNRADVPRPSAEEEEFADIYHERLHYVQGRQLIPLQEDLADWINKTIRAAPWLTHRKWRSSPGRSSESCSDLPLVSSFDVDHITGENFFDALDNGVMVCRLARVIQEKARSAVDSGRVKGPVPVIRGRCWENAARRSFFSRDNMENFIQFCRRLGVHENLLFESDDLVLHGQPRNVVLCLLEVARLASRYALEPPGIVQLEREIAAEQERDLHCLSDSGISHSSLVSWQYQSPSPAPSPRPPVETIKHSRAAHYTLPASIRLNRPSVMEGWRVSLTILKGQLYRSHAAGWFSSLNAAPAFRRRKTCRRRFIAEASSTSEVTATAARWLDPNPVPPASDMRRSVSDNGPTGSDGVPSDTTEDDWSRGSAEDPDEVPSPSISPSPTPAEPPEHSGPITELDRKVRRAAEAVQRLCQCPSNKCSKLKVRKVGEGRYHIAGRNVFIRLLKGRHMMVRVGGGWDTLEHFLTRHDPCQVRVLSRESTPPPHSNGITSAPYLHIRAKYRSPPPESLAGR
ncbi:uncharacterized protein LOC124185591 isoform X1 [Neodiprion fabricii]|uniref:uncharacterized protein LOC124185591 isoform X1 n=2 Tax=Neodiprion fabricii TaxID=2872261 RepID=UPI001ED92934|nr:uncharacterized protein LOC124185591 isoform X1 [Neodiprion fabricii]XP_046432427.1 uncharacterized protein LOC124185591 isoform X1 [Neodiprion fabricii]